jgi:pimeloyl-ACP methyl ester carboxylesterase
MTNSRTLLPSAIDRNSVTDVDGIEVHVAGDGSRTMVFVHGWPDTWRLWERQVAHFAPRGFRCVRFTLPGFDIRRPRRGHSLDEVTGFIARVIDAVSPAEPVVLVVHDWGCLYGYQVALAHPQRVAAVVGIDIADAQSAAFRRSLTLRSAAMAAGYQLWLTLAWRIAGLGATRLADRMTRWMAHTMGCRSDPADIGACMNYPYDITWTGSHGGFRGRLLKLDAAALPWPMFYAWGTAKPFMFHSGEWVQQLSAQPRHRALPFDCGHWVMRSRADAFNAAVERWLEATLPAR